jgi:hypothetical protein
MILASMLFSCGARYVLSGTLLISVLCVWLGTSIPAYAHGDGHDAIMETKVLSFDQRQQLIALLTELVDLLANERDQQRAL